jgi:hypothetical protein
VPIVSDLMRPVRTWLGRRSPPWTVREAVAGLTASGDTELALVVQPPAGTADTPLLLETWSVDECLEVREFRPIPLDEERFVVIANYANRPLDTIDHWRVGSPGGTAVEVKRSLGESGARTRYARVLTRTLLVPGDRRLLAVREGVTLHHSGCEALRWVKESDLKRDVNLHDALARGVHICRRCLPRPIGV